MLGRGETKQGYSRFISCIGKTRGSWLEKCAYEHGCPNIYQFFHTDDMTVLRQRIKYSLCRNINNASVVDRKHVGLHCIADRGYHVKQHCHTARRIGVVALSILTWNNKRPSATGARKVCHTAFVASQHPTSTGLLALSRTSSAAISRTLRLTGISPTRSESNLSRMSRTPSLNMNSSTVPTYQTLRVVEWKLPIQ